MKWLFWLFHESRDERIIRTSSNSIYGDESKFSPVKRHAPADINIYGCITKLNIWKILYSFFSLSEPFTLGGVGATQKYVPSYYKQVVVSSTDFFILEEHTRGIGTQLSSGQE